MFLTKLPAEFVFEQTMINSNFPYILNDTTTIKLVGFASIESLEPFDKGGFVYEGKNFVTVHCVGPEYWVGLISVISIDLDIPNLSANRDLKWKWVEGYLKIFY